MYKEDLFLSQDSGKSSRKQESYKNYKKKRIRQEFKNTRILVGETFLASPAKIGFTWTLPESQDLLFSGKNLV